MPLACITEPDWVTTCGAAILIEPPTELMAGLSTVAGAAFAVMVALLVAVTLLLATRVIVPPAVCGDAVAAAAVWAT